VPILRATIQYLEPPSSQPPPSAPNPLQAGPYTHYASVYGRLSCDADAVVSPYSTEELAAALRSHSEAAAKAAARLKVRATHS